MIAITGATGQLGQHVIENLLKTTPASHLVAIVRNPKKAAPLSQRGIAVRQADYANEAALTTALQGVDKLLLISSSEVGQRTAQHRNVIQAAIAAKVKFIAYTSLLHADKSPLALADEHIETEKMLAESGIPHTLLRNGWYTENYLASVPAALKHGVFIGAAGEGKIASAMRADYAAAAALKGAGLPDGLADMLANSDAGAAKGGLFDDSHTLRKLIGRPTTTLTESLRSVL
ncbi:KR domain-containing protein [Salmonella enterica subsp. enterica serovar Typhimurium]|nr:NAD-dependent epimerase/dehydratase family protein [Salmonella enterica subsp. enterica serovar Typhimurium]EDM2877249.1 KR domain-containing protein [Salmonella enterica subsp. enterica serovar Typhimurium]